MPCWAAVSNCNPSTVIVVKRDGDELTESCLVGTLPLKPDVVSVEQGGQMAAMAGGLAASRTPLVAFTDDDAIPRPDWIERLMEPFSNSEIGGVGGHDIVMADDLASTKCPASEELVGIVTPWGRLIGNHHIGIGPARYVDVLKGVNCVYRPRQRSRYQATCRGSGAQVHNEVAIGLRAKSNGWKLLYDPQIIVEHYPGKRFDVDTRSGPAKVAAYDAAYNLTLSIGSQGFAAALRRVVYGLLIGDRSPGSWKNNDWTPCRERETFFHRTPWTRFAWKCSCWVRTRARSRCHFLLRTMAHAARAPAIHGAP